MEERLCFLNSFYNRGVLEKNSQSGKWEQLTKDFLLINIKDCNTNESSIKIIAEPTVNYWITKSRDYTYSRLSLPEDVLIKHTCKYKNKELDIADALGLKKEYFEACRQGYFMDQEGRRVNVRSIFIRNNIINSPFVYGADFDIEDQYKNHFMNKHGRNNFQAFGKIKHGFLDIEADQYIDNQTIMNYLAPINSITYYDTNINTEYILVLFNQPDNKDMVAIKNNPDQFINEELRPIAYAEYNYKVQFFDTEKELIMGFWDIIHLLKPDFVGIWNMNFDIPYILERMKRLYLDVTYACHPDVPKEYQVVSYRQDPERNLTMADRIKKNDKGNTHPSRLWDWVNISGYTQFYDQMALYSHIRKRNILPSYKLDDIAEAETGHGKLDYHKYGYTIRKFAHQNFKMFLAYSAIDTLRLRQIENETDDLTRQIIFADNTRLSKSTKVSFTIKNKMFRFYWDKNPREIIGNNVTYDYFEKLVGAIVAKPENIRIKGKGAGDTENGLVYDNIVDYDETSLYPSALINYNIGKETVAARVYATELNGKSIGDLKQFNTMLQTRDTSIFHMGKMFFDLPNIEDIIQEIETSAMRV